MDDPMTIIKRHHRPALLEHMFLYTLSFASNMLGEFDHCEGTGADIVTTWIDEEDKIVVQLSSRGVFITGDLPKEITFQIAGMCHLQDVPLFLEDNLLELIEKESPSEPTVSIN